MSVIGLLGVSIVCKSFNFTGIKCGRSRAISAGDNAANNQLEFFDGGLIETPFFEITQTDSTTGSAS